MKFKATPHCLSFALVRCSMQWQWSFWVKAERMVNAFSTHAFAALYECHTYTHTYIYTHIHIYAYISYTHIYMCVYTLHTHMHTYTKNKLKIPLLLISCIWRTRPRVPAGTHAVDAVLTRWDDIRSHCQAHLSTFFFFFCLLFSLLSANLCRTDADNVHATAEGAHSLCIFRSVAFIRCKGACR